MRSYRKPFSIVVSAVMVFSAAGSYLFFQEAIFPASSLASEQFSQHGTPAGQCGDGICGPIERETGFCPQDCSQGEVQSPISTAAPKIGFLMGFMVVEPHEIDYALDLGAKGARCGFWFMNNKFHEMESAGIIQLLIDRDFELVAQVVPMPPSAILLDHADFKNKLKDLVRKKKGIFKYWQIGNEPDLIHQNINPSYSAENYVELFLAGSEAVREECPACKIVLAGISNQYDSSQSNYQFYQDILLGIKKKSKFGRPFDVFDVHLYPVDSKENYVKAEQAVNDYRKLLKETGYPYGFEFISTEFGTYSAQPRLFKPRPMPFQSESFQAATLVKLYTAFFNAGLRKAFWVDVINNYKFGFQGRPDGLFDLTGLIYNGKGSYDMAEGIKEGMKKESYYAFKTFAAKIQDKDKIEKIGDHVYQFSGGGHAVYVAWSDGAKTSLPPSIEGAVKVTDYLGNEAIKDASEVIVDKTPVFVELAHSKSYEN